MTVMKATVRDALDQYKVEMESRDYARGTRYLYETKLRKFRDFYEGRMRQARREPYVSSIDAGVIGSFLASYGSPYTRNDALGALRGFIRWCVRMRYISSDDAAAAVDRRQAKVSKKPKHYIAAEEFPLAFEVAEERHRQERAAAAVALFTLCRVSEITFMQFRHVNLAAGELKVWRQKRNRWTTTVISPDFREELDYWLAWYASETGYQSPAVMMAEHPDWYLVPRVTYRVDRNASGQWVADGSGKIIPDKPARQLVLVVKRILDALGVEGETGRMRRNLGEGMHTFRRSGARALLLHLTGSVGEQRALFQVSKMLDHEDIQTTMRYIGLDIEKQQLDNFLRTNRMFGDLPRRSPGGGAVVVPIDARSVAAETTTAPAPYEGAGEGTQAL